MTAWNPGDPIDMADQPPDAVTRPRCGARRKSGGVCKKWPVPGRTRCKLHGGKSLRGPDHPNWKHGMFSSVLPTGLAEQYARARQNPDLIALTEHIALVDGRTFELFEQLSNKEAPAWSAAAGLVAELRAAQNAFHVARKAFDGAGMQTTLQQQAALVERLSDLIARGLHADAVWDEVKDTLYLRKKLFDSEVRRRKLANDTMPKDRVIGLLAYIHQLIVRHVKDPAQRQAISDGMRLVMGSRGDVVEHEQKAVPA